ncbi:uncharacterized protein LOC110655511 [Hevea brasiliensis]|uniref:uncharacterized protein LOC110655511 n=1 Tax=Hevea brasiliensis TaxID=3981 RepID=UPI0025D34F79|nr:uncharacterized protein LOC110655511 [Hevea brasiliensis]
MLPPSPDISQVEKPKRKSRYPSSGADSPLNSPYRRSIDGSRHSTSQTFTGTGLPLNSPSKHSRHLCSSNNSMDSPNRDSPGSARRTKLHLNSSLGVESPARDQPSIPRNARGRNSKGIKIKRQEISRWHHCLWTSGV